MWNPHFHKWFHQAIISSLPPSSLSLPPSQLLRHNLTIDLKEEFSWYDSQGGAYLFRPLNYSAPILGPLGHAFVSRGQIVEELVSRFRFRFERRQEGGEEGEEG